MERGGDGVGEGVGNGGEEGRVWLPIWWGIWHWRMDGWCVRDGSGRLANEGVFGVEESWKWREGTLKEERAVGILYELHLYANYLY